MTTMSFFEYTSGNGQGFIARYTLLKPIAETLVAKYLTKFIVCSSPTRRKCGNRGDHERECLRM
jgi:hypothetical protein